MTEQAYLNRRSSQRVVVSKLSDEWIENSRYKYHHPSTPQSEKEIIERLFQRKGIDLGDQHHYTQARSASGSRRPPPRSNPPPSSGGNWWQRPSSSPPPGGGNRYEEEAARRVREEQARRSREYAQHQANRRAQEAAADAETIRRARQAGSRHGLINSQFLYKPAKAHHMAGRRGALGLAGVVGAGAAFGAGSYMSNRNKRVTKALTGYNPKEKRQHRTDAAVRGVGVGVATGGTVAAATAPRRFAAANKLNRYVSYGSEEPWGHIPGFTYDPMAAGRARQAFREGYKVHMPPAHELQAAKRLEHTLTRSGTRRLLGGAAAIPVGLAAMGVAGSRMRNRDRTVKMRKKREAAKR